MSHRDSKLSFEQQMPSAFRQLTETREIAERYFKDVCDLEFSVQDGQFYVLQVRRAKRTPIANLRFALQFLVEGNIGPQDMLRRVSPNDVAAWLTPVITNSNALRLVGSGLPACAGVATGKVAFRSSEALASTDTKTPVILVRNELSPEDLQGVLCSEGVLTSRGGVSSHAALACRQLGKPCVCGYSPEHSGIMGNGDVSSQFQSGDWITINGHTGEVFEGRARYKSLSWRDYPELVALAEIVSRAVATGNVPRDKVGQVWRMNDFFLHTIPLTRGLIAKKSVSRQSFASFEPPTSEDLARCRQSLIPLASEERGNYGEIFLSVMDWQFRTLSSTLGVGNHPQYFRPLWDPKQSVYRKNEYEGTQLVGMEFFGLNRHVPHLIDVASITIILELDVHTEGNEWFLDFTNPAGESFVIGSILVQSYRFLINNTEVPHADIPLLYDSLRRREYGWKIFEQNDTTHSETADALAAWASKKSINDPALSLCYELGLIRNRKLTLAGESLLGKISWKKKMNSSKQIALLDESTRTLDRVIDAVIERGYEEQPELTDDYGAMLASFEHRKLVTFQLYDSYFPPKRHEFELQLLTSFVDAVVANPTVAFLGGAVASGVVGNAVYDMLKHLLSRLISKSRPIKRTHDSFKEIEENVDRLMKFFEKRSQAAMIEICEALDADADKVEPLLKLLGFRCLRKGKRRIWIAPNSPTAARKPKRK